MVILLTSYMGNQAGTIETRFVEQNAVERFGVFERVLIVLVAEKATR